MNRAFLLAVVASLSAVAGACSKPDAPPPLADNSRPAETASGSGPPSPPSSPAPASAPPSASAAASASALPSAQPSPPLHAAATVSARASQSAPICGDKPLPPCPLYAWMKANTSPAMAAQDFGAMAVALDKVVAFAPAGYTNWASIARDGASAARAQNYDGVRAACRGCHNQYKDKYKKEMRDRAI